VTHEFEGVIGDDRAGITETIRETYSDFFELAESVNRTAHDLRSNLRLDPSNTLHLVAICLFQRLIEGLQADIVLSEVGLGPDANAVFRTALEAGFVLIKLNQDPDFLTRYVGLDHINRKKLINVIRDGKITFAPDTRRPSLETILAEINEDIDRLDLAPIHLDQLADSIGMAEWYESIYRQLSSDAHVLPKSLERYEEFSEAGKLLGFDFTPNSDEIPATLLTHASFMITCSMAMDSIFVCDRDSELHDLLQRARAVSGE